MKKTSLPTSEKLSAFATECNEFIRQNHIKKTINDFVLWTCGKCNPFWRKSDGRSRKFGDAVKPLYKLLIKLFTPGCTGKFPMEERFTEDFWIETSVEEMIKLTGQDFTKHHWDYARKKLVATGVMMTRTTKCQEGGVWFTKMWVKIDFARLQEILEQMHVLRMEAPKITVKPGKKSKRSQDPLQRALRSSKLPSGSSFRDPADSCISIPSSSGIGEDRELSTRVEATNFEKDQPFGEVPFKGQLDFEISSIVRLLKSHYGDATIITNDNVRTITNLNNQPGDRQMTPMRVGRFTELASSSGFLPDWMLNADLDMFLTPRVWSCVAKEVNRFDFSDAQEAMWELDLIEAYPEEGADMLKRLNSDRERNRWFADCARLKRPSWHMWALYGHLQNWKGEVFEMIREKAVKVLEAMPVWFARTAEVLNWKQVLNLSDAVVEKLNAAAAKEMRKLEWLAYMGRVNGVTT